jgi:hypothetical protein
VLCSTLKPCVLWNAGCSTFMPSPWKNSCVAKSACLRLQGWYVTLLFPGITLYFVCVNRMGGKSSAAAAVGWRGLCLLDVDPGRPTHRRHLIIREQGSHSKTLLAAALPSTTTSVLSALPPSSSSIFSTQLLHSHRAS